MEPIKKQGKKIGCAIDDLNSRRVADIARGSCLQFYRCFLILFHCKQQSPENGLTSMPSKTTVIQLNRRVYSNNVACTAQLSPGKNQLDCSTPVTERSNPSEVPH